MFIARIVIVPNDAAEGLSFPNAGTADELDYTFDFGPWLGSLDRVVNATVEPDASISLGAVVVGRTQVIARIGPAIAAGTYVIGCAVITSQGRVKSVSAGVTLQ
ncbi:MAG: hypothetical protein WDN25_30175 [Acetobacteraceae bacterium]